MTLPIAPDLNLDFAPDGFENNGAQVQKGLKQMPSSSKEELHKEESLKFGDYELKSRKFSYFFAAASHFFTVVTKLFKIDDSLQKKVNSFSLGLSKLVHSLAYGSLAIVALKDDRSMDAIVKVLDPLMSNFSSIENINLTKGISGGLGILDFAQASRVDKINGKRKNLITSIQEVSKMVKEVYTGGLL